MVIHQGDVYCVELGEPAGSDPGYRRPFVVIQNDLINRSRMSTVITCALTTNLKWADAPGNVALNKDEANLPKSSVVNVSQVYTFDKNELRERAGRLSAGRVRQILAGLRLLTDTRAWDAY